MNDLKLDKMTQTQLKDLEKSMRQERARRKDQRTSHDMCGIEKQLQVLRELDWIPQTADELAAKVAKANSIRCSDKEVRWVMRTYSIAKTNDVPSRFYKSKDKVKRAV